MVLGPARFTFRSNFQEENKVSYNTNETFPVFIDLFTFLSSIRGFPDASEGWKIKLTRTYGNFVLLVVSLWRLKLLVYTLNSHMREFLR